MKIKNIVAKEVEEVSNVVCNMCGEEIKKDEYGNFADYVTINKTWGYLSNMDGEKHSADICQECYMKIIGKFAISPTTVV